MQRLLNLLRSLLCPKPKATNMQNVALPPELEYLRPFITKADAGKVVFYFPAKGFPRFTSADLESLRKAFPYVEGERDTSNEIEHDLPLGYERVGMTLTCYYKAPDPAHRIPHTARQVHLSCGGSGRAVLHRPGEPGIQPLHRSRVAGTGAADRVN